jgi:hypothetical protein
MTAVESVQSTEPAGTTHSQACPVTAGKTAIIKLTLDGTGRVLLSAGRGRLSAHLTILMSSPLPSQTHTESVELVQQKARGKAKQ